MSEFEISELIRVSAEVKKQTGTALVDVDLLIALAKMKRNPTDYDTSLPALAPGVKEVIVDIFTGKGMTNIYYTPEEIAEREAAEALASTAPPSPLGGHSHWSGSCSSGSGGGCSASEGAAASELSDAP